MPNSRLTVIERAKDTFSPKGSRITNWKCKCDCGKIKEYGKKSSSGKVNK